MNLREARFIIAFLAFAIGLLLGTVITLAALPLPEPPVFGSCEIVPA